MGRAGVTNIDFMSDILFEWPLFGDDFARKLLYEILRVYGYSRSTSIFGLVVFKVRAYV